MVKKNGQKSCVFSAKISDFCSAADKAIRDNLAASEDISRLDKLTQDYLHMLELGGLNYKERAKIATKISKCRQDRRRAKDVVDTTGALVEFLKTDKGKVFLNTLKEILGQTRKIEKTIGIRSYKYKILDLDDIA